MNVKLPIPQLKNPEAIEFRNQLIQTLNEKHLDEKA